MDEKKASGISIEQIYLVKNHISMNSVVPDKNPEFNLKLVHYDRELSDNNKQLIVMATFDLMYGIKDPIFDFKCSFAAQYTRTENANMNWDEFTNAMALTHLIPYVREFASNMTNRLLAPVLMIPPVNVHALLEGYEAIRKQRASKPEAESSQEHL